MLMTKPVSSKNFGYSVVSSNASQRQNNGNLKATTVVQQTLNSLKWITLSKKKNMIEKQQAILKFLQDNP